MTYRHASELYIRPSMHRKPLYGGELGLLNPNALPIAIKLEYDLPPLVSRTHRDRDEADPPVCIQKPRDPNLP